MAKRKSSPVSVSRMNPDEIRERYKPQDLPVFSDKPIEFMEEEADLFPDAERKRRSGRTETRMMNREEREKYSNPSLYGRQVDPSLSLDEFLKDKPADWATFLEDKKEMEADYKKERGAIKKNPNISEKAVEIVEEASVRDRIIRLASIIDLAQQDKYAADGPLVLKDFLHMGKEEILKYVMAHVKPLYIPRAMMLKNSIENMVERFKVAKEEMKMRLAQEFVDLLTKNKYILKNGLVYPTDPAQMKALMDEAAVNSAERAKMKAKA